MNTNNYVVIGIEEKDETDKLTRNLNEIMNEAVHAFGDAIKDAQARLESETLTMIDQSKSSDALLDMMKQGTLRFEDFLIGTSLVLEKRQAAFLPFVMELQKQGCPDQTAAKLAAFVLDRILQTHDWIMGNGNCCAKLVGTKIRCAPLITDYGDEVPRSSFLVEVEFSPVGWVLNSVTPRSEPSLKGVLDYEFTLSSNCDCGREMLCEGF